MYSDRHRFGAGAGGGGSTTFAGGLEPQPTKTLIANSTVATYRIKTLPTQVRTLQRPGQINKGNKCLWCEVQCESRVGVQNNRVVGEYPPRTVTKPGRIEGRGHQDHLLVK